MKIADLCLTLILFVVIAILALDYIDPELMQDADLAQMEYCTFVQLWNDSQGQYGHPDYKGTFSEYCKKGA